MQAGGLPDDGIPIAGPSGLPDDGIPIVGPSTAVPAGASEGRKVCCMWLKTQEGMPNQVCKYGDECKHLHYDDPSLPCSFFFACRRHAQRNAPHGGKAAPPTAPGPGPPPLQTPPMMQFPGAAPPMMAPLPCRILHTVCTVEVPEGAAPGTQLVVNLTQHPAMRVAVPPGCFPGQPIEVDVPAPGAPLFAAAQQPQPQLMLPPMAPPTQPPGLIVPQMAPPPAKRPRPNGPSAANPAEEMKPGDWLCELCGFKNFASRAICFNCNGTGVPSGPAVGRPPAGDYAPGQVVCCMFLRNMCKFGDQCKNMHEDIPGLPCSFATCRMHMNRVTGGGAPRAVPAGGPLID